MKRGRVAESVVSVILALTLWDASAVDVRATAQNQNEAARNPEGSSGNIRDLIVVIDCDFLDGFRPPSDSPQKSNQYGAGIIFGIGASCIYVLTADHVVRGGLRLDQKIRIKFSQQEEALPATLMSHADNVLDLAVLRVEAGESLSFNYDELPFHKLADPTTLTLDQTLFSIGYPDGDKLYSDPAPSHFIRRENDKGYLYYQSGNTVNGYSGGALLNDRRQIVGMIKALSGHKSVASDIKSIIGKLEKWHYPVNLGKKLTPMFESIATKEDNTCALSTSGHLYCWGLDRIVFERVRDKPVLKNKIYDSTPIAREINLRFRQVYLGEQARVLAIARDGTPFFWSGEVNLSSLNTGINTVAQPPQPLPGGRKLTLGSIGLWPCGTTVEGETYCWDAKGSGDTIMRAEILRPEALDLRLVSVTVGHNYACGIDKGGAAFCWGENKSGQLGDGSLEDKAKPSPVFGGHRFVSLSAGWSHTCGITDAGKAYCWGTNSTGQLGSRVQPIATVPELVAVEIKLKSISAGKHHTCALSPSGSAYCWGKTFEAQPGKVANPAPEPTLVSDAHTFMSISVGSDHACALSTGGVPYCWGRQGSGEYGFPYGPKPFPITGIRSISALTHKIAGYLVEKRFPQAEEFLSDLRTLMKNEKDNKANFDLAWASYETHRYSDMEEALQAIERSSPSQAEKEELSFSRALLDNASQNYESAVNRLQEILKTNPKSARAHNKMGEILIDRGGSLSEALSLIKRAAQIDDSEGDYFVNLGRIYYQTGDLENAEENLRLALEKRASYIKASDLLGDVFCGMGRGDEAITQWRLALEEWKGRSPSERELGDGERIKKKIETGCSQQPPKRL